MLSQGLRHLLFASVMVGVCAQDARSVIIYRVGTPFSAAEKDSLDGIGVDFREVEWSASQFQDALELDSLQAGSLQPNFFDEDEDIAATLLSRGGFIAIRIFASDNRLVGQVLLDKDSSTSFTWPAIAPEAFSVKGRYSFIERIVVELGGVFLIKELRLRPLAEKPEHFLEGVILHARGFGQIAELRENKEPEIRLALNSPITAEALTLEVLRDTPKEIGLVDFELFGGGYVTPARYESDVIELDDIASLGEISWSGREDPHAQVAIRTRAGTDPQPVIFWESRPEQQDSVRFLSGGGDLSLTEYKRQYDRLSDLLKPEEDQDKQSFDTENWSFWSSPYPFDNPGVPIVSPGPRKFVQISTDFTSTTEDGGKIDYVEFKASSPPLVRELVGEIYPTETKVGEPTSFTYYINPTILSTDISFDGVEISTSSGVVSVDSLRLDAIDHDDFSWTIDDDGLGFVVLLPRRLGVADTGALVEVVFTAPVLREVGTVFAGRVFDTANPHEVRQRVVPGNAADEIEGDRLSVTTSLSQSLVFSPRVSPNPFTPNGDGVNDVVNISYKLLRVTSAVPVSIEVFDLSGRLVARVYAGEDPLGEYAHFWDGTDASNALVPPGLYLYRLVADLQSGRETTSGVVAVAY